MPNVKEALKTNAILGNMSRSTYDQDGNNIVDQAEVAVPAAHTHGNADLTGVPGAGIDTNATAHAADTTNPHSVTAVQTGAAAAVHAGEHAPGGNDEIADLNGGITIDGGPDALADVGANTAARHTLDDSQAILAVQIFG